MEKGERLYFLLLVSAAALWDCLMSSMEVADVFDAVSAKRCYRDAMPLDQCFRIIADGSGQDFDPVIAETFLEMRDQVTEVVKKNR